MRGMLVSLVYPLLRQILQMPSQLARGGGAKDVEFLVERLMRGLGIAGVVRGRRRPTTVADPAELGAARPAQAGLHRAGPNVRWVADLTEVAPGRVRHTAHS